MQSQIHTPAGTSPRLPATASKSPASSETTETRFQLAERIRRENECWSKLIGEVGRLHVGAVLEKFVKHGSPDEQARQSEVVDMVRGFCDEMPGCLTTGKNAIFLGTCGTAKDFLMIGMSRRAIQAGCYAIEWTTGAELYGRMKDAIQRGETTELVNTFSGASLLILSDVLPVSNSLSAFEAETLFRIIDKRHRNMLPTWISANVGSREKLAEGITEKILSRLQQNCLSLLLQWGDYRRLAK